MNKLIPLAALLCLAACKKQQPAQKPPAQPVAQQLASLASDAVEQTKIAAEFLGDGKSPVVEVSTDAGFEQEVLNSAHPVLADFFATWCGPCKLMKPGFIAVSRAYEGRVAFVSIDVDKATASARKLGIQAVPTLILFRNGEEVRRVQGAQSPEALKKLAESLLEQ
ncbi:thioredoxin [bacterium]|nr:thioredoxin [bacterium]